MKRHVTGKINLLVLLEHIYSDDLLDNLFDEIVLIDSTTNTTVKLEIMDYDLEELLLLGENDQDDIKLA